MRSAIMMGAMLIFMGMEKYTEAVHGVKFPLIDRSVAYFLVTLWIVYFIMDIVDMFKRD